MVPGTGSLRADQLRICARCSADASRVQVSRVAPCSGSANAARKTAKRVPELPRASSIAARPATLSSSPRSDVPASCAARAAERAVWYRLVPVSPSATGKMLMALRRSLWLPRDSSALLSQRFIATALAVILVCKVIPSPEDCRP